MSKIKKLIMISLSAAVFALFVLMTLLSLPSSNVKLPFEGLG